jgi:hypothetical protein
MLRFLVDFGLFQGLNGSFELAKQGFNRELFAWVHLDFDFLHSKPCAKSLYQEYFYSLCCHNMYLFWSDPVAYQASTGRRYPFNARSMANPAASARSSRPGPATTWTPIGMPSCDSPVGTTSAGHPVALNAIV